MKIEIFKFTRSFLKVIISIVVFPLMGCTILKVTGQTIVTTGKVVVAAANISSKVITTTGKIIGKTGDVVTTVIKLPGGKNVIKLEKYGNSYFVDARLNKKVKTKLLLDTGCTNILISPSIALSLKLDMKKSKIVFCEIANGQSVRGKKVNIKEVRLGKIRAYNIDAIILDEANEKDYDGLLGMSFLSHFNFKIDTEKDELILEKK